MYPIHKAQTGFTLLELMVAMVIFALLAMSGWQIMDSISKSRDRAKIQIDQLSQLEYAYLQLSQDFAQVSNYVPMSVSSIANQNSNLENSPTPTFVLNGQQVSFIRFANPDPRFNPSPVLAKIQYTFNEGNLVRQRFYGLNNSNETPAASLLLSDVKELTWTALTPDSVANFPDPKTLQQAQLAGAAFLSATSTNPTTNASSTAKTALVSSQQLPKGVEITFVYHDEPYVWRFALPTQPPGQVIKDNLNSPTSNPNPPVTALPNTNSNPAASPSPTPKRTSNGGND